MNKSNLADLVNFSNSTKKTESKLNFGKNTISTSNQSNRFYIGKAKNEVSYSDMMFKKDQNSSLSPNLSNNINNFNQSLGYSQTQRKAFINNNKKK